LERILELNPRGSFVALLNKSRVGIITTIAYGRDLAWIGNVIVDKRHRGKHVGQGLVEHALAYLKSRRVKHVGLYCFSNNVGFYRRLGFVREAEFVRLRRDPGTTSFVRAIDNVDALTVSRLVELDRKCFGADRSILLRSWIAEGHAIYYGLSTKVSAAYLIVKKYGDMYDFGPGVAVNASEEQLSDLIGLAISRMRIKRPIELSCLTKNCDIIQLLKGRGFRVINRGYRMYLYSRPRLGSDSANFLLGFQDKG
jgi:predicted GNAT family acetyltransferase